ncbi:MAG: hypothetical protein ACI4VH_05675 [Clostridia bacterium]
MIEERKKVEKILKEKIKSLENEHKESNKKELEKFNALYRLITNQYNTFFNKLDINVALKILEDIGIEKENLQETYKRLMQEEIGKKYILMDIDLNNKEER